MNQLKDFFAGEVLFLQTNKDKWNLVIFISLFTPVFLLIFQPFGVNNFDQTQSIGKVFLFSMLGFGLVQGLVLIIYEFGIAPLLFRKKNRLVFIFRLLLEMLFIASSTFLYYNILGNFHDWHLRSFLDFVFNISLMSIIPFTIIFFYSNYKRTQKAYRLLELQPKVALTEKYINLQSYNGKERLIITLANLLYIEAQDNYVSIHHIEKGKLKKHLLRAKMKDIENNLKAHFTIRCHRSFIVNINKVDKVERDGHQMKLYLPHINVPIPVSRSYISSLEALLDVHHK